MSTSTSSATQAVAPKVDPSVLLNGRHINALDKVWSWKVSQDRNVVAQVVLNFFGALGSFIATPFAAFVDMVDSIRLGGLNQCSDYRAAKRELADAVSKAPVEADLRFIGGYTPADAAAAGNAVRSRQERASKAIESFATLIAKKAESLKTEDRVLLFKTAIKEGLAEVDSAKRATATVDLRKQLSKALIAKAAEGFAGNSNVSLEDVKKYATALSTTAFFKDTVVAPQVETTLLSKMRGTLATRKDAVKKEEARVNGLTPASPEVELTVSNLVKEKTTVKQRELDSVKRMIDAATKLIAGKQKEVAVLGDKVAALKNVHGKSVPQQQADLTEANNVLAQIADLNGKIEHAIRRKDKLVEKHEHLTTAMYFMSTKIENRQALVDAERARVAKAQELAAAIESSPEEASVEI